MGPDALAMERRMQVFQCKTIPNCRTGYEVMFRNKAMHIIHWVISEIAGLPLFDDQDITYGDEGDDDRLEEMVVEEHVAISIAAPDVTELSTVDESILPYRTVVRAHLDVFDAAENANDPPRRITSAAYALDSEEYHASVYLNIQDYQQSVDLNGGFDYEYLFNKRAEQGWAGTDSLYHAWLLVNYRRAPQRLSIKLFKERYPNWKEVILPRMNLSPTEEPQSQTGSTRSLGQSSSDKGK